MSGDFESEMRRETFYPRSWNNREYDTGNILFDMVFGPSAEERYGAPYLLAHRGDLHAALASVVPVDIVNLNHQLVDLTQQRADGAVDLVFANGTNRASMPSLRRRRAFLRQARVIRT